ncbi:MAG: hypothetical protein WCF68_05400 [Terriglobales bacterium]
MPIAVPEAEVTAGLNAAPDDFFPETSPAAHFERAGAVDRKIAVHAALKGGALGALIAVLIPFLGIVLAGTLAVFFYRRESRFVLPVAMGMRLGGAAGVVAFAIYSAFLTSLIFITHSQQKYLDSVLAMAKKFGGDPADPDLQASIHTLLTPTGLAFVFFFGLIIAVAIASAGGALASLLQRTRNPRL